MRISFRFNALTGVRLRTQSQARLTLLFGRPVPKDSVNRCLRTGSRGREPRFERVAYGRYRLLSAE
jgi:hypothetical protein